MSNPQSNLRKRFHNSNTAAPPPPPISHPANFRFHPNILHFANMNPFPKKYIHRMKNESKGNQIPNAYVSSG